MKVDHIGYLVKDMDRTVSEFLSMGYCIKHQLRDDIRKIDLTFLLPPPGGTILELVRPIINDSVVSKLLQKSGVSPYHICYLVPSLEKSLLELRQRHWIVTVPPEPAPAFDGRRVAFLYHSHGGLIELLEEAEK